MVGLTNHEINTFSNQIIYRYAFKGTTTGYFKHHS